MKTIVEALQDLYVALGGKKADVSGLKLNPDVIEQIAALVNEGALNELPDLTGNAGKVLTVSSGASGVEWADAPEELPAVTSEDSGDVLTVNASGEWEAAPPSGGGGSLPNITADDIGQFLGVVGDSENTTELIIIPEQSVTTNASGVASLSNVSNFDSLYEDFETVFKVNGEEKESSDWYEGYWWYDDNYYYQVTENTITVTDTNSDPVAGTFTVSLKQILPSPQWGKSGGFFGPYYARPSQAINVVGTGSIALDVFLDKKGRPVEAPTEDIKTFITQVPICYPVSSGNAVLFNNVSATGIGYTNVLAGGSATVPKGNVTVVFYTDKKLGPAS